MVTPRLAPDLSVRRRSRVNTCAHPRGFIVWGTSPSLLSHDLGRALRVKAKPLRGRFPSPDTSGRGQGMAATRRPGEVQDGSGQGAVLLTR